MEVRDFSTSNIVSQVELFKTNSQALQLEAFRVDSLLSVFNNCADRCNLQFRESGIKNTAEGFEDVACF